jgi:hypothetical protein
MQLAQAPPNVLDGEVGFMFSLIERYRAKALSPSNMIQQHSQQAAVDSRTVSSRLPGVHRSVLE